MPDDIHSSQAPLPPGMDDSGTDKTTGSNLEEVNQGDAPSEAALGSTELELESTHPSDNSTPHPRAGYGRLPQIQIVDDTVRQSAKRVGKAALILVSVVVVLTAFTVLATFLTLRAAPTAIDFNQEALEVITLPDGQYEMTPQTFLVGEGRCLFGGRVNVLDSADATSEPSSLVIAGSSLAECGVDPSGPQRSIAPPAERVIFVVAAGTPSILRLEQDLGVEETNPEATP